MTNGTPSNLYVPSDVHLGGQRTSASQLKRITTCWQLHFLSDMAPHPEIEGSTGLAAHTVSLPLLTGIGTHAGLHQYFLSGWRDGEDSGERDVMKAITYAEEIITQRRSEAPTPEDFQKALDQTQYCLTKFDEQMAASGLGQYKVVADGNGEPVLEREFQVPLAEGRFVYIDKIDGVFEDSEGYHCPGEYKTASYSSANTTLASLHMQGQSFGHMACLTLAFPDAPLGDLLFWVLVKDRGAKSKLPSIYERLVTITPESVRWYLHMVEEILEDTVERATAWENLVREGMDAYEAGLMVYPQNGILNGQCQRYNRPCEFASYCEAVEFGPRMLKGFRPRLVKGEPYKDPTENVTTEGELF